ncbi:MAG: hypothetical protein RJA70_2727 [Pseudomonadota bacterium]|jgi:hypothetical protein
MQSTENHRTARPTLLLISAMAAEEFHAECVRCRLERLGAASRLGPSARLERKARAEPKCRYAPPRVSAKSVRDESALTKIRTSNDRHARRQ